MGLDWRDTWEFSNTFLDVFVADDEIFYLPLFVSFITYNFILPVYVFYNTIVDVLRIIVYKCYLTFSIDFPVRLF